MFKLVAFLFLAASPSEPFGSMSYNRATFSSEKACTEFVASDAGQAATGEILSRAEERSISVKFACVKQEDNTI